MTNYLANLTVAELESRLAKIEVLGKRTAANLARGDRGETVTLAVRRGSYVGVSRAEAALNWQRLAWKDTKIELNRRLAA